MAMTMYVEVGAERRQQSINAGYMGDRRGPAKWEELLAQLESRVSVNEFLADSGQLLDELLAGEPYDWGD